MRSVLILFLKTGLKLNYNSDNQKLLAEKAVKIHSATHRRRGETVTIVVCMSVSGNSWGLLMVLCK
jgi:hypothetical protein